ETDAGCVWINRSLTFAINPILVIVAGSGIELPSMAVAFFDLLGCAKGFIVFVNDSDSFAQFIDYVLMGCRRGPANRLVPDIRASPIGIQVPAREDRRSRMVLSNFTSELIAARGQALSI